jgi:membrane protein CcdC involved in cytochrome C biogenesis
MADPSYWLPGLATAAGAALVLAWRVRETRRPVSPRSILLPPLGMSSGFGMFLIPDFRVSWAWALGALSAGALLLAIPLVRSTRLARQGNIVMMRRSRAFLGILLGLVAVRLLLRGYIGHILPARQTAGVFFMLAFGMIARWRAWMWVEYRRLMGV